MNQKITALGNKCLRLVSADEDKSSFLGGKPFVGSEIDWPRKNGMPLGFIGQLDLREINANNVIDWLPQVGRLLFFYDFEEWPWGFDPEDKGGWAVLYENSSEKLQHQESPSDLNVKLIPPLIKYVKAVEFISYPDGQRVDFTSLGISAGDNKEYYTFIDENYGDEPRHQIGGYPSPVQSDSMEEDCQLVSGGVYCGNSEGYNSEQANKLRCQKSDWKLLLQFDSDDDIDVMWGDMGMLYFWVRESEAKNGNFTNSWMVLQCG